MMQSLPPLPKIEGDVDLVLDVYTHRSLRGAGDDPMNDDYGDTERLAELGTHILNLAVTYHYYTKKPLLTAEKIAAERDRALSDENVMSWASQYGLQQKLRLAPGARDQIDSPQELRQFFNTYVGALQIRNGMAIIQDWIGRLIDPESEPTMQYVPFPPVNMSNGQPPWPSSPAPPSSSPPPLPSNSNMAASNLISLAVVNQVAAQQGVMVTYSAESQGPPHLPLWTVKCIMNGVEQGSGTGKSQKRAKEEAARQAFARMGWGV